MERLIRRPTPSRRPAHGGKPRSAQRHSPPQQHRVPGWWRGPKLDDGQHRRVSTSQAGRAFATTTTAPVGQVGVAYPATTLRALRADRAGPISSQLVSGVLPPGLQFNGARRFRERRPSRRSPILGISVTDTSNHAITVRCAVDSHRDPAHDHDAVSAHLRPAQPTLRRATGHPASRRRWSGRWPPRQASPPAARRLVRTVAFRARRQEPSGRVQRPRGRCSGGRMTQKTLNISVESARYLDHDPARSSGQGDRTPSACRR